MEMQKRPSHDSGCPALPRFYRVLIDLGVRYHPVSLSNLTLSVLLTPRH